MKAQLNFDLDNEDDKDHFIHTTQALSYFFALEDIAEALRSNIKYGDGSLSDFRDKFFSILSDRNITL
jgi:hypothetical protein